MRTRHLFAAILAGAALFACTKENNINPNIVQEDGNAFIKVNIAFADGSITKAGEDGGYETSTAEEHAIKSVYFAFYDDNGNFVTGTTVGESATSDITDIDTGTTNADELKSEIVIALTLKKGQARPTKMVAYVNATPNTFVNLSLDEAKEAIATSYQDNGFTMTNSTYLDENNAIVVVCEKSVDPENDFMNDKDAASAQAGVTVHVERLAAKVTVKNETTDDDIEDYVTGNDKKLRFSIENWGLTGTSKKAYYLKKINPDWANALSWTWNKNLDYRCFWALDPTYDKYDKDDYDYITFNKCTKEPFESDYCLENTLTSELYNYDIAAATHIVITGTYTVLNTDGTEDPTYSDQDLYLRFTKLYLEKDLLNEFVNIGNVYSKETGADGEITFNKLGPEFYKLVKADANNVTLGFNRLDNDRDAYWVREQQDSSVDGLTPGTDYIDTTDGYRYVNYNIRYTDTEYDAVLKKLCGTATVYKEGKGYFTKAIEHLAPEGTTGQYGVVRNHQYVISVKGISGLANGIFDPENDEIIPQPETETLYLSTELHILSWKVVNQNVTL